MRTDDGLHWDVEALVDHAIAGLATAYAEGPLASIGVDSWAVDYGRLRHGRLLGQPFHYRDERRTAEGPAAVAALIGAEELYRRNGLQYLPFNTLYQLAADTGLAEADELLLIPDLVATALAGNHVTERTNASTTGLLDVTTREWDTELMVRLGLDPTLFPDLVDPGHGVGDLLPHVAEQVGGRRARGRGRLPRHGLRGGRRPDADRRRGVRLPRHLGPRRSRARRAGADRGGAGSPTSPTRAASTARSAS